MFYRKILISLTICALFFVAAYSQEQEQSIYADYFQRANELYKKDKFEEALTLYKKIPNPGAIVSYDMGNCAYKQSNYGYALTYWRRAERSCGLLGGSELLNNIRLLKNKLRESKNCTKEKQKNEAFLQEIRNLKIYFDFFVHSIPLLFLQIVFLLLWILTFLFIRDLFKTKRKTLVLMLFTTIAISGLILVVKYNFEIKEHGVVVSKNANLLSGPGQNYQILSFMPEASEVVIEKAVDGYFKIKINGQNGWIDQSSVEKF